jgi:hypothetical protein
MTSANTNFCGTGDWSGPKPGDPDNNSILRATPAFGGVDVTFSYPESNPAAVAHTLLYRAHSAIGAVPSFDDAIERAVMAGNFFYDKVDSAVTYYYWIRIVSVNGTVGALIGPASASSRPLIQDLILQLSGQINSGTLATSLRNEIDQLSVLNANLATEVFDRETGETSFAEALLEVQNGIAEAHTFILNEVNTRIDNNQVVAGSINGLGVTFQDQVATVVTNTTAAIEVVNGKATAIGALYTTRLTANGLVGGFGVFNDGTTVEAGFDVDTFWVGRTNADKRKPFIVVGNETFIDEAVINKLTFSKLRSDDGAVIVEAGKLKADYIETANIAFKDGSGNIILQNGIGEFSGALKAATGSFGGTLLAGTLDISQLTGQNTQYNSAGTYTLTVPASFTSMRLTLIGGGGGGASGGGGGGGGGLSIAAFAGLTPGTTMTLVVGAGGTGGYGVFNYEPDRGSQPGNTGASTTVAGYLSASGGNGGGAVTSWAAGPGGAGGYGSSTYGSPGNAGTAPAAEGGMTGGKGGNSGANYGVGGAAGSYGATAGRGYAGGSYGGGGGGGDFQNYTNNDATGGTGGVGKAIVEFYNPNGVIIRSEWNTLQSALQRQGVSTV